RTVAVPTMQYYCSEYRGDAMSKAYRVMERVLTEGFAAGKTEIVDELFSPDLIEHQFGLAGAGADALEHVRAAMRNVHEIVPDLQITIEDAVETGDTIWVRFRGRGTATGPFFGPPSGQPLDFTVIDICRIVDGRIAEHWGVPDRFAILAQTGALNRLAS